MGNGGLGQMNSLLDITAAKTGRLFLARGPRVRPGLLQSEQNPAASRIGNGVQRAVERRVGNHGGLVISRKSMSVNLRCQTA